MKHNSRALARLCLITLLSVVPSPSRAETAETANPSGVRVLALGTVQDGGLPHTACNGSHCERARRDPGFARRVASIAILTSTDEVYLVDATPDITDQIEALPPALRQAPAGVDRQPLDGVLLTHAHIGHYVGLTHLGFEVVNTKGLPIYATPKMTSFLAENGPWSQLVEKENVRLVPSEPGVPFKLAPGVTVTPLLVPHRDEYSDTVAFRISGPERTLLYLSDTEPWGRWEKKFLSLLEGVDFALLDASFYSADELPGRPVESIGHPLAVDTIDLLAGRVSSGKIEVFLTHMNHSNPLVDPKSQAHQNATKKGFKVLKEGQVFDL